MCTAKKKLRNKAHTNIVYAKNGTSWHDFSPPRNKYLEMDEGIEIEFMLAICDIALKK